MNALQATTPQPTLCVSLQPAEASILHGQDAQWIVSAWAENGDVPGATIKLSAAPTSLVPEFSFGCNPNATASCDLGTVFAASSAREVSARVTVPATATSVTSVNLTATASASGLVADPAVSIPITVNAGTQTSTGTGSSGSGTGGSGTGGSGGVGAGGAGSITSPLPVGSLPTIGGAGSTSSVSPGGNAAGLFPTINPSAVPNPSPGQNSSGTRARQVANTQALPIGTPVVDAQLAGLAALGVAFLLAVTRLSVRKRPATAGPGMSPESGTRAGEPGPGEPGGGQPIQDRSAGDAPAMTEAAPAGAIPAEPGTD